MMFSQYWENFRQWAETSFFDHPYFTLTFAVLCFFVGAILF